MINITIDGKPLTLESAIPIIDAAERLGIEIPRFCYHPLLERFGGCRMCMVEVEKMRGFQTACTLKVNDGMVIHTDTDAVKKARKSVLEFLLINHPLDCPTCDKAGECDLQNLTTKYGPACGRFEETKWREREDTKDPLIVRNMERCIMCTRCVRMCAGLQGASAIAIVGRGKASYIEPFHKNRFDCEYCGGCITVCPVGALMSKLHRYRYRPWDTDRQELTVCPHCGVGCNMRLQMRAGNLQRAIPEPNAGPSKGLACARGYFGYDYRESADRLDKPMLRKYGKLAEVSWDEAMGAAVKGLMDVIERHGPGSVAVMGSVRGTNEENYLLQKIARGALQTNHIDSMSRVGGIAGVRAAIEALLEPGITSNLVQGIVNSDAVLVMGGDPTAINPVLGVMVRNAHQRGARVITLGHTPGLAMHRSISIADALGLTAIAGAVLAKRKPSAEYELLNNALAEVKFAPALGDALEAADALINSHHAAIVLGPEMWLYGNAEQNLLLAAAIASALEARLFLLSPGANENGLLDMGCDPMHLPGGVLASDTSAREALALAWGCKPLPTAHGRTLMEIVEGINDGKIKALYVMGANPAFGLPHGKLSHQALQNLDCLIVQDPNMSETAKLAHVVLPASTWGEKEGTYTNLERRVQHLQGTLTGKGRADWMILTELGSRLGLKMPYKSPSDIMTEIASINPLYTGLSYADLKEGLDLWPYRAKVVAFEPQPKKGWPVASDSAAPAGLALKLHWSLPHFGSISRLSPALMSIAAPAVVMMGTATAQGHELCEGDEVELSTAQGQVRARVSVDRSLPAGEVHVSNHGEGAGVMAMFRYNIIQYVNTVSLIPTTVTLKRVGS